MVIMALISKTFHDYFGDMKLFHRRHITESRARKLLIQRQCASQSSNRYKLKKTCSI
jgi:hypothetical protein